MNSSTEKISVVNIPYLIEISLFSSHETWRGEWCCIWLRAGLQTGSKNQRSDTYVFIACVGISSFQMRLIDAHRRVITIRISYPTLNPYLLKHAPRSTHQLTGSTYQITGSTHQITGSTHQLTGSTHQLTGSTHQLTSRNHQLTSRNHLYRLVAAVE